jgi:hypothetical protein
MKILSSMLIIVFIPFSSWAADARRSLEEIYGAAPVVIKGRAMGAAVGNCGGEKQKSIFFIRVSVVMKGKVAKRDIKACGSSAPFVMFNEYIVSGKINRSGELLFDYDGVVLFFPPNNYYRLISDDSPIVSSGRGYAYAIATEEDDFKQRLSKLFGSVSSRP